MISTFTWRTPPGPAAIALVTVPARPKLLDRPLPEPGRMRFARLLDRDGAVVDEVVATREGADLVELATHGGSGMRTRIATALTGHGLVEDSDVAADHRWRHLSACAHPAALPLLTGARAFPSGFDQTYCTRRPLVLITGPVNAGKSTLLNAWCGRQRALVSSTPGTTRDLLTATTEHRGWRLDLLDSAGLRATDDELERAGMALVAAARQRADLILHLGPGGQPQPTDLIVHGKADLVPAPDGSLSWSSPGHIGEAASAALLAALADAVLARLGLG